MPVDTDHKRADIARMCHGDFGNNRSSNKEKTHVLKPIGRSFKRRTTEVLLDNIMTDRLTTVREHNSSPEGPLRKLKTSHLFSSLYFRFIFHTEKKQGIIITPPLSSFDPPPPNK